jgi:serine/threonine protein kinase
MTTIVLGRTAVDSTWSDESYPNGPYRRLFRAIRCGDAHLDREVALKLLPADPDDGEARASSIIHEGRLLARVRHPNIVTIYGAERIGDTIGLWMERVDGETVEQRLSRQSPLQPSAAIEIGVQICHAVAAVHKAGLLHRDIKAQNVMLAGDGRAVLMTPRKHDAAQQPGCRFARGTFLRRTRDVLPQHSSAAQLWRG